MHDTPREQAARRGPEPADGPAAPQSPPVNIFNARHPHAWSEQVGVQGGLYNDFTAEIIVDGRAYPTVTHAYWALSTTDPQWRERITIETDPEAARQLARHAPRRPDWPAARLAVMADLLRAKYRQHPQLAADLLATGDAPLLADDDPRVADGFWSGARNWLGRLLEIVRSEPAATQAGLRNPPDGEAREIR